MSKKEHNIISCFIDETGDFGKYDPHCPYYMVAAVLHDQSISIEKQLKSLENYLSAIGFSQHALHTGPLLRRESDYKEMNMEQRRKLFNLLYNFARKVPIKYFCAKVKKSECIDVDDLEAKLTKAIKAEVLGTAEYWNSFERIIIYYDNGQKALKRILNITFNSLFSNVEVRKVKPSDYRLFQVADLICTLELVNAKIENGGLSKSEKEFFISARNFKKEYWRKINRMKL